MKTNIKNEENSLTNYESLINKLRSQEEGIIKRNRRFILIGIFLLIAWSAFFIFENPNKTESIFSTFLIVLFTSFLFYNGFYIRKFKKINYADSIKDVLISAEKRYCFWNNKMIFEVVGSVVLSIGFAYFLYNKHVQDWPLLKNIIVSVSIPVLTVIFSMYRSYSAWKKEKKPLWISAKELLKELEQ